MDEELRAFLTQRFDAIEERFTGVDQRFIDLRRELTERIDAVHRELGVVIERQQDQIRLIAEGRSFLAARIERVEQAIESMGREILAAVKFSYAELDRRLTRLEALTVDLESRLSRLERER